MRRATVSTATRAPAVRLQAASSRASCHATVSKPSCRNTFRSASAASNYARKCTTLVRDPQGRRIESIRSRATLSIKNQGGLKPFTWPKENRHIIAIEQLHPRGFVPVFSIARFASTVNQKDANRDPADKPKQNSQAASKTAEQRVNQILDYWFGTTGSLEMRGIWFSSKGEQRDKLDAYIKENFKKDLEAIKARDPSITEDPAWQSTRGIMAQVTVMDQFSRHIFRGTKEAFAQDEQAAALAKQLLTNDRYKELPLMQRLFLRIPLEHSEKLADHELDAKLLADYAKDAKAQNEKAIIQEHARYAKQHEEVIRKFGRFPHRNEMLGRQSTPEELTYMKKGEHSWAK